MRLRHGSKGRSPEPRDAGSLQSRLSSAAPGRSVVLPTPRPRSDASSRLLASKIGENTFVLSQVSEFVLLCYSSCRELIPSR